jgi:hypothetical protein
VAPLQPNFSTAQVTTLPALAIISRHSQKPLRSTEQQGQVNTLIVTPISVDHDVLCIQR